MSTAQPEEQKTILVVGMILVRAQEGVFVEKYSPRLLERNTVLPEVRGGLPRIPLEAEPFHARTSVPTA